MAYTVAKNIIRQPRNRKRYLIDLLFLIVALPVAIISFISLALYYFPSRLKSLFVGRKIKTFDIYNHEVELWRNEHLTIFMIEDEHDITLTELNEEWMDEVYHEETYLYRIKTNPIVPALENRIGCFYFKQEPEGIILQLVKEKREDENLPDTELLFLRHETLEIIPIESTGAYYLYNDEVDQNLIRGFNKREHIEITLHKTG